MLQRIRQTSKQGLLKLSHVSEVDEIYIGGKEVNKHTSKKLNLKVKVDRGAVVKTNKETLRGKIRLKHSSKKARYIVRKNLCLD